MSVTEGGTGPADDRPLTQQEYQQVQRLFSDPFSFPIQFKTWLVSYLETSNLNLPFSAVNGLINILGITGVGTGALGVLPAGIILPYAGLAAPTGSLLCDGSAHLISSYPRLWAAIKDSGYGQPDASSFYVPDMQGRVPVGKGTHSDVSVLGANDGLPVSSRSPRHRTSDKGFANAGVTAGSDENMLIDAATNEQGMHHHGPDGAYPVDTPAYAVFNFIIVA